MFTDFTKAFDNAKLDELMNTLKDISTDGNDHIIIKHIY